MSEVARAMGAFLRALRRWAPHIKRITHATVLTMDTLDEGKIVRVLVKWPNGEFTKEFKREDVFPRIGAGIPLVPKMATCAYRDQLIREVLTARGVIT